MQLYRRNSSKVKTNGKNESIGETYFFFPYSVCKIYELTQVKGKIYRRIKHVRTATIEFKKTKEKTNTEGS